MARSLFIILTACLAVAGASPDHVGDRTLEEALQGECDASAAAVDEQCALSLRQLRGQQSSSALAPDQVLKLDGKTGMAFEGGGFRALNTFAGVVAGLLVACGSGSPTLESSKLLDSISAFSSVSGGTWFFASLAYSKDFADVVESMAANPADASSLWKKGWIDNLMKIGQPTNRFIKLLNLIDRFDRQAERESIFEMARESGFFWTESDGNSWTGFIGGMLKASAGISEDMALGQGDATWAKGKIWLLDHSILAASGQEPASMWAGRGKVQYFLESSSGALPAYVPAAFSTSLGGGETEPAPMPFLAPGALAAMDKLEFSQGRRDTSEASLQSGEAKTKFEAAYADAPMFKVHEAVAASSAAGGAIVLSPHFSLLEHFLGGADFTPWMSSAGKGQAFKQGWELVSAQASPASLAQAQVRGAIDGGYTDNTAIGHLVAGGATEVISLLDIGSHNYSESLAMLFGGDSNSKGYTSNTYDSVPYVYYQIFAEPQDEIRKQLDALPKLIHPGSKWLRHLSVGTIKATTVDNKWFGTQAGREVTIRVVAVSTTVWVDTLPEFEEYGLMVKEIIGAMSSEANAAIIRQDLLTPLGV